LREEFEEAGGAEEIEVVGVEMAGDFDGDLLLAFANPAVFDAGEAFVVDVDGSLGDGATLEDFGVVDGRGDEQSRGSEKPPCRERVLFEREPGDG
jgi:hypothetical protein